MDAVANTQLRRTIAARIGWGGYFGFLCFMMIVIGLESALHFVGPAIDGPFQLYNALRRIWVGQTGGVDFQFFHGLAIPYLHFIPFRLLGGTFIASEIARELVSVLSYPITVVIVLRFFIRDWTRTLAWAAIVMTASIALRMTSILVAINSLLGIRSTLPVLLPVALCLRVRPAIRTMITGVLLGGSLAMGTEQGMAVGLALAIAFAIVVVRTRGAERKARAIEGASILAVGVVTLIVGLIAIGGVTGMRGALAYNFKLVPMDQYWYFGAPPNLFLSSWGNIPAMMTRLIRIPVTLVAGTTAAAVSLWFLWRDAAGPRGREQLGFTTLALYGIISCASLLGTYVNAYIQPELRVLLLLGAILADRIPVQPGRRLWLAVQPVVVVIAVVVTAGMVAIIPAVAGTIRETIPHFFKYHVLGRRGAVYAEMWPETIVKGQEILDARRDSAGHPPSLWSTYAGLLEARNGMFHPTVDYIIHALGPEARVKYVDDFRRVKPRLVQTVSPEYTQYESWIESTSWDFYTELLRNYDLVDSTRWSFFWERRATPLPPPESVWATTVLPGFDGIQLPAAPAVAGTSPYVLYQVEIDYQTHNPLHVLPIIGSSPRYLVRALNAVQHDPVTLNPYVTRERFPLIVPSGSKPVLQWAVYGLLPGAHLEVRAVRLSVVQLATADSPWLDVLIRREQGEIFTTR